MKPNFALNLSHDGIDLFHRAAAGWNRLGTVALDDPDLTASLAMLRRTAVSLEAGGMTTKIIIPESQILYTEVEAPTGDAASREAGLRKALEGMTPYAAKDLVFDWRGKGRKVLLAVIARETLNEAEAFAREHRFNPVSFAAAPESGAFKGEPFFGPATSAAALLRTIGPVEPDAEPINVRALRPAKPAPARAPDATQDATQDATPDAAPAAASDGPPPDAAGGARAAAPASGPGDTTVAETAALPAETEGEAAIAPALAADAAESFEAPAFASRRTGNGAVARSERRPAAADIAARRQAHLDRVAARANALEAEARPAPDRPAPRLVATGSPPTGAAPKLAAPARATPDGLAVTSPRSVAEPPPPRRAALRGGKAEPAFTTDPAPRGPVVHIDAKRAERGMPRLVPLPTTAPAAAAGEAEASEPALNAFGARKAPAGARSPALVVILTLLLLAILAAVALWSTFWTAGGSDVAPVTGEIAPAPLAAVPEPPGETAAAIPEPEAAIRPEPAAEAALDPAEPDSAGVAAVLPEAGPSPVADAASVVLGVPSGDLAAARPSAEAAAIRPDAEAALAPAAADGAPLVPGTGDTPTATAAAADPAALLPPGAGATDPIRPFADPAPAAATDVLSAALPRPDDPVVDPDSAALPPPESLAEADEAIPPGVDPEAVADGEPDALLDDPTTALADTPLLPQDPVTELVATDEGAADRVRAQLLDELTPEVASRRYDMTGVWVYPPSPPAEPVTDRTDDIYVAAIDTVIDGQDAVALPLLGTDLAILRPVPPAAAGTRFDFDERGLIRATPEGALTPDGIVVYLGRPAVAPAARQAADAPAAETPVADPATPVLRPRPRPGDLSETNEKAQLGGRTRAELGTLRPRQRPVLIAALAEAVASPADAATAPKPVFLAPASALAVATSLTPRLRPDRIEKAAAALAASASPGAILPGPDVGRTADSATAETASADAGTVIDEADGEADVQVASAAPNIPTKASVAKTATVANAINLSKMNLIGVYGSPSERRALVRLASGKYVKVKVGDRIDGGKVAAIGESEIVYVKGSRQIRLQMPKT